MTHKVINGWNLLCVGIVLTCERQIFVYKPDLRLDLLLRWFLWDRPAPLLPPQDELSINYHPHNDPKFPCWPLTVSETVKSMLSILSILSSHTSQSCLFFFILQINKSWYGLWFLRTSASPRPEDVLLQLQQKGVQGRLQRVWEESRKKKTRTTLSLSVNLDF